MLSEALGRGRLGRRVLGLRGWAARGLGCASRPHLAASAASHAQGHHAGEAEQAEEVQGLLLHSLRMEQALVGGSYTTFASSSSSSTTTTTVTTVETVETEARRAAGLRRRFGRPQLMRQEPPPPAADLGAHSPCVWSRHPLPPLPRPQTSADDPEAADFEDGFDPDKEVALDSRGLFDGCESVACMRERLR